MSSVKDKLRDRKRYSKFEFLIKRSIKILKEKYNYGNNIGTVNDIFDWWISNKSTKEFIKDKNRERLF